MLKNFKESLALPKGKRNFVIFSLIFAVLWLIDGVLLYVSNDRGSGLSEGLWCLVIMFATAPIVAILFGILSYRITRSVIFPNLCLFVFLILFVSVPLSFVRSYGDYSVYELLYSLIFAVVPAALSLVCSFVASIVFKSTRK